ncbi:hypothetical protein CfE428DRAFT_4753 [Chthoniobacter flavus Ellin428]|uniref:FlgD/Vpr Ig-like domain-containing protein n=1 Tax=Chthoniobacter flavus Ellin428 TaxID=497964 RepID=B4D763_9BACT|nr:FlgD immunoglobulin-like domain containing protein [Chthoniobacter flavus]EDY17714.1 hypothetical protein CfE428DRAFT_4753 [Chthoniobacter flavus Ellin428]TCO87040.1 putative pyrroloquinoline-quinone-binding quinoprotein [Chthoniobacter flavus]
MEFPHRHAPVDSPLKRLFVALCLALAPLAAGAAGKAAVPNGMNVHFSTPREGYVMVNIYRADGTLVRRLEPGKTMPKGAHDLTWDGLSDDDKMVEPGDYTWKGLFHEGIGLKLRGWVGSGADLPWKTADGEGGWGGDRGVPSAVTADDTHVYLGWSLAEDGHAVVACDPSGHVVWRHRRSEGPSGCKALAVDDGLVYVLGGLDKEGAEGKAIYRLDARDGKPVPWPNGSVDLKIFSFWPADTKSNPDVADAMAVRHGHIYLSFTNSQFLTVLDAKSGAYLQTVVGAAPGMIDIAPTQTELPDAPGKMADADFGVIAIRVSPELRMRVGSQDDPGYSVLGRILFAHDPFWVITSDMAGLKTDAPVTALTVVGERAKFHARTAFLGFGAPVNQLEARPLLDAENPTWVAGRRGGRALLGPWQADGLHSIRGVAMAPDGKLWVAESDAYPKRFSVWDTTGKEGKLVHEFFGPMDKDAAGSAINPLDPDVMFAQGCEWRIDRKTGVAKCLGVVTREPARAARYGVGKNGHAYLIVSAAEKTSLDIYERIGEGDYKLRTRFFQATESDSPAFVGKTVMWVDENGDGKMQDNETIAIYNEPVGLEVGPAGPNLAVRTRPSATDAPIPTIIHTVKEWSACGAPRYDFKNGTRLAVLGSAFAIRAAETSPDMQMALVMRTDLACVGGDWGKTLHWSIPEQQLRESIPAKIVGSARLLAPVNNAWLVTFQNNDWSIWTEDGFNLAHFFAKSGEQPHWPKAAVPGAEMTHAGAPQNGRLTQARDGKLYVEAGDTARWNMEVTGLEKVKALPGGKLTVPAAK